MQAHANPTARDRALCVCSPSRPGLGEHTRSCVAAAGLNLRQPRCAQRLDLGWAASTAVVVWLVRRRVAAPRTRISNSIIDEQYRVQYPQQLIPVDIHWQGGDFKGRNVLFGASLI
jgi:hypothetical protein